MKPIQPYYTRTRGRLFRDAHYTGVCKPRGFGGVSVVVWVTAESRFYHERLSAVEQSAGWRRRHSRLPSYGINWGPVEHVSFE